MNKTFTIPHLVVPITKKRKAKEVSMLITSRIHIFYVLSPLQLGAYFTRHPV